MELFKLIWAFFKKVPTPMPIEPIPDIPPKIEVPTQISPREHLYNVAKSCIDIDASPKDVAPDDLACAESMYNVLARAFPGNVGFPLQTGTIGLYSALKSCPLYEEVDEPDFGDIIIVVSGTGNGKLPHGHTGDVGKYSIMSNNSDNGLWQTKFTRRTWDDYYVTYGGFKNHFIRRIKY